MLVAEEQRGWWIALVVLVLIVLLAPLLGGGIMGWGMPGPGMMGWPGGPAARGVGGWDLAMALGGLAMLAFWGVAILGSILLLRALTGAGRSPTLPQDLALDILKRRYAAGELTREQYDEMRRVLEQ